MQINGVIFFFKCLLFTCVNQSNLNNVKHYIPNIDWNKTPDILDEKFNLRFQPWLCKDIEISPWNNEFLKERIKIRKPYDKVKNNSPET